MLEYYYKKLINNLSWWFFFYWLIIYYKSLVFLCEKEKDIKNSTIDFWHSTLIEFRFYAMFSLELFPHRVMISFNTDYFLIFHLLINKNINYMDYNFSVNEMKRKIFAFMIRSQFENYSISRMRLIISIERFFALN